MALPLEGIKVVETASVVAGPMASWLLADWGADVIKVEHPLRGDVSRNLREAELTPISLILTITPAPGWRNRQTQRT